MISNKRQTIRRTRRGTAGCLAAVGGGGVGGALRGAVIVLGLLAAGGCPPPPVALAPVPPPLSREQAFAAYNANAAAVGEFRCTRGDWEVSFADEKGDMKHYNGSDIKVYYRPPAAPGAPALFYLLASVPFESQAWVVGSNEKEFWMYSKPAQRGWWGQYAHLGERCANTLPIGNPQLVLQDLGVLPLSEEVMQAGATVYLVLPEQNVIQYTLTTPAGVSLTRQIIIDRRSNDPIEINTYDARHMLLAQSKLADYQELGAARLPSDILVRAPESNSFLHLRLQNFKSDNVQRAALFLRPQRVPGIKDYQQIDAACEGERGKAGGEQPPRTGAD
jgi:hypothetical protein